MRSSSASMVREESSSTRQPLWATRACVFCRIHPSTRDHQERAPCGIRKRQIAFLRATGRTHEIWARRSSCPSRHTTHCRGSRCERPLDDLPRQAHTMLQVCPALSSLGNILAQPVRAYRTCEKSSNRCVPTPAASPASIVLLPQAQQSGDRSSLRGLSASTARCSRRARQTQTRPQLGATTRAGRRWDRAAKITKVLSCGHRAWTTYHSRIKTR
ncbi:hypothetical protein C8Q80DRAFT_312536 [Daedaleopsis nitida]|nr:hypothetical protein C8Q80DRAFT_312536 [Daedaleopsis nitida]